MVTLLLLLKYHHSFAVEDCLGSWELPIQYQSIINQSTNQPIRMNGSHDAANGAGSFVGGGQTSSSYGYDGGNSPTATVSPSHQLRRRTVDPSVDYTSRNNTRTSPPQKRSVSATSVAVKKLDFLFPKVDTEYTVQTDRGGLASLVAYLLIAVLALAETASWLSHNRDTVDHVRVDTSLGQRMRVNLNITFPSLACDDLHVDVMDVAGDSQLNIEDTLTKRKMDRTGRYGQAEILQSNQHEQEQSRKAKLRQDPLPDTYCGPCYGAQPDVDACCNNCDALLDAYKLKGWRTDLVLYTAEQCIREGRDQKKLRPLIQGEGCNLSGFMSLNRVAGNFHIAMGEGLQRDGRHIHVFDPEDSEHYNASHVIHHLSFGPEIQGKTKSGNLDSSSLNGVTKMVTPEHGTTGLFQYFIKVVPTTYLGPGGRRDESGTFETNRYFYTERFRPLMKEYLPEEAVAEDPKQAAVHAGGGHRTHDHHHVRNSVLPGVFFLYEIYPFAVEIHPVSVPLTHLLIRLMATIGGVFTIVRWVDTAVLEGNPRNRRSGR